MKKFIPFLFFLFSTPVFAAASTWDMIAAESKIAFHGQAMNKAFSGEFKSFNATILFDPDHPEISHVTADVVIATVESGDADRDKTALGPDWFDADKFPKAHFESTAFKKTAPDVYEVTGNLTIKGTTLPLVLPFNLIITPSDSGKDKAMMTGKFTVDRSKFAVGTGEWADTSTAENAFVVDVTIAALRRP